MQKKLIIFDMDGTILNTLEDIADAVNYILKKYDKPTREVEEVKFFVGNGLYKTLERSVPPDADGSFIDQIYPEFTTYYNEHANEKTRPYDGIVEVMKKLRKAGYHLAVVSNKRQEAVEKLCEVFFQDCFDIAMGDQEGMQIKPAPDMVYQVLKQLEIEKSEAVYIGDSDVDIMTAKNSGLDCISVEWGFRDKEFLIAHGATTIIDKPIELESIFGIS